jgi:hypothetical protein
MIYKCISKLDHLVIDYDSKHLIDALVFINDNYVYVQFEPVLYSTKQFGISSNKYIWFDKELNYIDDYEYHLKIFMSSHMERPNYLQDRLSGFKHMLQKRSEIFNYEKEYVASL